MIGVGVAAVALLALLAAAAWIRWRRYDRALRASPNHDDRIVCYGQSKSWNLAVNGDEVELPALETRSGRTAFFPVTVVSDTRGKLVDPFIEARCGQHRWRQYFERGAAGRRYLNLTSALTTHRPGNTDLRAAGRVTLRGHAIRWKEDGPLILFDSPGLDEGGQGDVLVLAPHPDDAEIAAYGIYATRLAWIVTVTAGDRGTADASTRVWDSLLIPQAGGVPVERCVNLAYPDGRLREMRGAPVRGFHLACEAWLPRAGLRARNKVVEFSGGGSDCRWADLVADLVALLRRIRPGTIVAPHPLLDSHPDHAFTTAALAEALGELDLKGEAPVCLLYVVHARAASPLFPFGPADGVIAPAPWAGAEPMADAIYSHALPPAIQRAKRAAVDAGHDLGSRSPRPPRTWRRVLRDAKTAVVAAIAGMEREPWTFDRRAPRPNEIYFVVSPRTLAELVERAVRLTGGEGAEGASGSP